MNLKLETEFSKAPILQEVDALKKQIDDMRPLSPEIEGRVMQKLRLEWNYNSNAIEGNKLSYGETTALLMHGVTAKGKPLKDHLDIQGHNKALEYLDSLVKDGRGFTEMDIRALHEVILVEVYNSPAQTDKGISTTKRIQIGQYKSTPNHVKTVTGEIHYYATPEETPAKMNDLMRWYNDTDLIPIHPVVVAALFHHRFVAIHPFDDGNGRMARILMNLILIQNGYPPVVIKMDDRINYYSLLSRSDNGDNWPFIEYIVEGLQSSLNIYLKAANGGDIDEDDDINKEIALFKMELKKELVTTQRKTNEIVLTLISNSLKPFFENLLEKAKQFDELFNSCKTQITYFVGSSHSETQYGYPILNGNWVSLTDEVENIKSFTIECSFNEFKTVAVFDTRVSWSVEFNSYNYIIYSSGKKNMLPKFYHESLTKEEENKLIRLFINDIKSNIQTQLKNKKARD
jgi:Fic family protein